MSSSPTGRGDAKPSLMRAHSAGAIMPAPGSALSTKSTGSLNSAPGADRPGRVSMLSAGKGAAGAGSALPPVTAWLSASAPSATKAAAGAGATSARRAITKELQNKITLINLWLEIITKSALYTEGMTIATSEETPINVVTFCEDWESIKESLNATEIDAYYQNLIHVMTARNRGVGSRLTASAHGIMPNQAVLDSSDDKAGGGAREAPLSAEGVSLKILATSSSRAASGSSAGGARRPGSAMTLANPLQQIASTGSDKGDEARAATTPEGKR